MMTEHDWIPQNNKIAISGTNKTQREDMRDTLVVQDVKTKTQQAVRYRTDG